MPTQTVSAGTMKARNKGKGKHWTRAQIAARKRAETEYARAEPVDLRPPKWLRREELVVWYWAVDQAKEVRLFDNLDTETLAFYCNAVVECRKVALMKRRNAERVREHQAWVRIIAQYSDKLGFTPAARARLAKKRAEEVPDEFGKKFDA
jgi:phage terminase small subunit